MNRQEACKILGIDPSATEDEIKKRYRELTKKYHPDINKEPGAEDRFKQINVAHSYLTNYHPTHPTPFGGTNQPPGQYTRKVDPSNAQDMNDLFKEFFSNHEFFNFQNSPFGKPFVNQVPQIIINQTVSFAESVRGTDRVVSYERQESCNACAGKGGTQVDKPPCGGCGGKGRIDSGVTATGKVSHSRICTKCYGITKDKVMCNSCHGTGTFGVMRTCKVNIPAGVSNGVSLRLPGMGNFCLLFNKPQYLDAVMQISVTPDPDMHLEGVDVVSKLGIGLLDMLQGGTLKVPTVYGDKEVEVKPRSKHLDEIVVPGCGIRSKNGNHRVQLSVQYPSDLTKVIEVLKEEK
jgi:molecular chaperone DnaJ